MDRSPGRFIEKIAHEACGSSDALAVYEAEDGTFNGTCWSCEAYVADPYGNNPKKQTTASSYMTDNTHKVAEIAAYPSVALPHRLLRQDISAYFGIRVGYGTGDGQTITHIYYPRIKNNTITAFKERDLATKDFLSIGDGKNIELFGMAQAKATGSKRLYITEGEDDCAILFQALLDNLQGTKWAAYLPAVTSLADGATSAVKSLSTSMNDILTFDEIVLVFDNDAAGNDAVDKALQILPLNKVKIAKLPLKDACDMYSAGRHAELVKLVLWKTQTPKIASVATAKEIKAAAKRPPVRGYDWPWPAVTKMTYGIRPGLIGVGAGVGVGKTSIWHQIQNKLIFDHGIRCGLFMLEESNEMTLLKLAGKQAGVDFTNPDLDFTQEEQDAAIDMIPDDLSIYRHKGTKDWEDIKQAIKHMVLVNEDRVIFIDPLTALVAHLGSSEANDELNRMFGELAGMITDLSFTLFYGAHLNPPKTGPSHEEGGRVLLSQFTGSKAMIKWSHYIWGAERNTQADSVLERNILTLRNLKDRDFGRTGTTIPLRYDEVTGRILEQQIAIAPPTTQHEAKY